MTHKWVKFNKTGRNKCPLCGKRFNQEGYCDIHEYNKEVYSLDELENVKQKKGNKNVNCD